MNTGKTIRIWPVLAAAGLGIAMLCGLGTWQVQRLHWKEGLLAQLAAKAAADPVDLAEAARQQEQGLDTEFLKVHFSAVYGPGAELRLISSFDGGPGWTIITPAVTLDGRGLLVDRGQVPPEKLDSHGTPKGDVEITGVIRRYLNGRARFDPDNDALKNQWYWWDIPAMLQAAHFPDAVKPEVFVVQLLPDTAADALPRPPEPRANLSNNHLGYAITWFGLALALLAVTAIYLRGQMKKSTA